jgi:hypothetical protein
MFITKKGQVPSGPVNKIYRPTKKNAVTQKIPKLAAGAALESVLYFANSFSLLNKKVKE